MHEISIIEKSTCEFHVNVNILKLKLLMFNLYQESSGITLIEISLRTLVCTSNFSFTSFEEAMTNYSGSLTHYVKQYVEMYPI